MILYKETKETYLSDIAANRFIQKLSGAYNEKIGELNPKEVQSWENSDADHMYRILSDPRLPGNLGVAVEYRAPGCAGRIDMALSGRGADGRRKLLFIELKQWTGLHMSAERDGYILDGDDEYHLRDHPSKQVYQYREWVRMSTPEEDRAFDLEGCAYLHNYEAARQDDLRVEEYREYRDACPMFYKADREALISYLCRCFSEGDGGEGIEYLEGHCTGSSVEMRNWINDIVREAGDHPLSPEQQNIADRISAVVDKSVEDHEKYTVIVKGGPGTGKSVVAIKSLFMNYRKANVRGRCLYLSKNAAPRDVFMGAFQYGSQQYNMLRNIMNDSGFFAREAVAASVLTVVDESQRVMDSTNGRGRNGQWHVYSNDNQIDNIVEHAGVSVFFIDEKQTVSLADAGTVDKIRAASRRYHSHLIELPELKAQFRCGGSTEYVEWVDSVLGVTDGGRGIHSDYDIEVVQDFAAFLQKMRGLNTDNNARIVAGYCWPWTSKTDVTGRLTDISIGGVNLRWNNDTWLGGRKRVWALEESAFEQVGCIHTCQGLEFDYIGVIIGEDLRYENGRLITNHTKKAEDDFTTNSRVRSNYLRANGNDTRKLERELDRIIRNTYRILLTRGMKGCRIYCVDPALGEYMKQRVVELRR